MRMPKFLNKRQWEKKDLKYFHFSLTFYRLTKNSLVNCVLLCGWLQELLLNEKTCIFIYKLVKLDKIDQLTLYIYIRGLLVLLWIFKSTFWTTWTWCTTAIDLEPRDENRDVPQLHYLSTIHLYQPWTE